ncbi:hypothetical protein ADL22_10845 [Streptomyces sp. NRRL F-4489]|nr:hypothetical protein ADL22_10845 [Streptomyces sp. NRRL F-4489]
MRGISKTAGAGVLLLGVAAAVVAGVHDERRALAREEGGAWAASYYPKVRAEIAAEERQRRAEQQSAWEEQRRRADCRTRLQQVICMPAGQAPKLVVRAYALPSCDRMARRKHPGWYQEDWRRGCEERRRSGSRTSR